MFKNGIGETSEFSRFHPLVNLIYFSFVIGITMFSMTPYFLIATLVTSWIYSVLLKGKKILKQNAYISIFTILLTAVLNVFFTHEGVTILFYINDNAITMESLIYGLSSGVMLASVIIWFTGFNVVMSADKLIFIFGKAAPVLGLTLSMIFRYVPLLKERYSEIHMGQVCLGRGNEKGFFNKIRQFGKEVSILVSWSLESSIESADSMEARGYGLKGRTSFNLYRIERRDVVLISVMTLMGTVVIILNLLGKNSISFYPVYKYSMSVWNGSTLGAYIILVGMPIVMDIYGEAKWRRSDLAI